MKRVTSTAGTAGGAEEEQRRSSGGAVEEQEEQRDGWQMELRRDANENGSRGWLTLHLSTGIIALTLLLLLHTHSHSPSELAGIMSRVWLK